MIFTASSIFSSERTIASPPGGCREVGELLPERSLDPSAWASLSAAAVEAIGDAVELV